MTRSNGRLAQAAKLLGVSRPTLYSLMESHGLSAEQAQLAVLADAEPPAEPGHPG
jgi:two-component system NtrC family response regulator